MMVLKEMVLKEVVVVVAAVLLSGASYSERQFLVPFVVRVQYYWVVVEVPLVVVARTWLVHSCSSFEDVLQEQQQQQQQAELVVECVQWRHYC